MRLKFDCDEGSASRAAIGLIVLQADETLEPELRRVFTGDGIAVYHTRIPSGAEVTPATLQAMLEQLPKVAKLLPSARPMDVIAYCCTSGATVIGPDKVAAAIATVHPTARITDPLTAVRAACSHLGINRIGLVTPYVPAVSRSLREALERSGIRITGFGSFEQEEEAVVARITPASVRDAIRRVGASADVDAVFASCTNLRSFDVIEACEAELQKPVITSNQALAWHILMGAGLPTQAAGPGRLFA